MIYFVNGVTQGRSSASANNLHTNKAKMDKVALG
jgi:hypothetical protein